MRERMQTFAVKRGKTGIEIASSILDERKDGSIRVTIAPRKYLLSHGMLSVWALRARSYKTKAEA